MRVRQQREQVIPRAELRRLHRLRRAREQVAMREDRTERTSRHRRGVDDHALLVASGFVTVALEFQTEMRAEVHARTRAVARHDLRRSGRVVEQHMHGPGRESRRERAKREHRADVRIVQLVRDLHAYGERVHEHRTSPIARRERDQELRRRRHEDRRATARE